jgi:hypothetical protein
LILQAAFGVPSASAADWRNLDERVSELEETAIRSGSRPLQLNIYGQANRAVLLWNDGFDSGAYGVAAAWQGAVVGARIKF